MAENFSSPLLQLQRISKTFPSGTKDIHVLKNIDLEIRAGEMIAIVGPSGSGKSTLMNVLGCLDQGFSGSYCIEGQEVSSMSSDDLAKLRREHFGFIFQRYHLLPRLNAQQNVELPAIYAGMSQEDRQKRAQELLERLNLSERSQHFPSQLSGGQQQRVAIARALMNGGHIILADEPTGALDTRSGDELMDIFHQLHQLGHTIVIITHNLQLAEHAERIIELRDGEIIADRKQKKSSAIPQNIPDTRETPRPFNYLQFIWQRWLAALKISLVTMAANRLRTSLTMLGIIIGIFSLTTIVALGNGVQTKIIEHISRLGSNTISFYPFYGRKSTLTLGDAEHLAQQSYVKRYSPNIGTQKSLRFGSQELNASVTGVNEKYFEIGKKPLVLGHIFSQDAVKNLHQVVIIDNYTRKKLPFPGDNPIGQVIIIGNLPCRVIAVLDLGKNDEMVDGQKRHANVYMPYTTVMTKLLGQSTLHSMIFQIHDDVANDLAEKNLKKILTFRHGQKDFESFSADAFRKTVEGTTKLFTLFITIVAAVSLVVGGIGLMNTMLMSITERTREIGIRMAVGARATDIKQQFLIEAVLVCLIGGLIGVLLSGVLKIVVSSLDFKHFSLEFSTSVMMIACAFSAAVGIVFGFLPAKNAAKLSPIEALARE